MHRRSYKNLSSRDAYKSAEKLVQAEKVWKGLKSKNWQHHSFLSFFNFIINNKKSHIHMYVNMCVVLLSLIKVIRMCIGKLIHTYIVCTYILAHRNKYASPPTVITRLLSKRSFSRICMCSGVFGINYRGVARETFLPNIHHPENQD